MFTGIVEEIGKILFVTKNRITVEAKTVTEDAKIGDSIAVNGVCLTVTAINSNGFDADVSPETFRVTNLGKLKNGSLVNLERAMPMNGRITKPAAFMKNFTAILPALNKSSIILIANDMTMM